MVRVAGLKAQNSIKKRLKHRYFPVNFASLFQKPYLQNIFGSLLLLILPFQPRFYHTFMSTLFSSFPSCFLFYYWHNWSGDSSRPFLRHPTLDPACCPFLKSLFALPSFIFHPLLRYFRQFLPPSHKSLLS